VNDGDPIAGRGYEVAEVFSHAPAEFEMKPWKLSWDSPCWLDADIILVPRSEAARQHFLFNLRLPHKVDAFARLSLEDQLWKVFSPRLRQITGPHANDWFSGLYDCYEELKEELTRTDLVFQAPFRFVGRKQFITVDLPTILRENPENVSMYLAAEKGSYCEYLHLRIHSSPPFIGERPKCLWYEKRLPDNLHPEDVIPWFMATVDRLPRKHHPADIELWSKRLLHFEPQLAPPESGIGKPWLQKPDLVFVLGPTRKVGYRSLTHFERRDINRIVRDKEIVSVEGKERHHWKDNRTTETSWTFHLLAFDEAAAERVEARLFNGERVHFGLDADVLGMICRSNHWIHAINAPEEVVRRLCVKPGLELRPVGSDRYKLKMYEACKPGTPRLEGFA
jgi:hypothetical protein